jgi:hypothetical protein
MIDHDGSACHKENINIPQPVVKTRIEILRGKKIQLIDDTMNATLSRIHVGLCKE